MFRLGLLIILVCALLLTTDVSNKVSASTCPTSGSLVSDSLIQAGSETTGGRLYSTIGTCVIDPKATFVPFKIPTYDELKSIYYTQAKSGSTVTKHPATGGSSFGPIDIPLNAGTDHIYYLPGTLTLNSTVTGSTSGIIFVDGDLNINSNQTYGTGTTGVVFVVKGNINIDPAVTAVNAVLIAEGTICTAYENGCPATYTDPAITQALVINGSIISISPDTSSQKIILRRNIINNTVAAESISWQTKYLVILKDLFTETLSITTEDTNYSVGL